MSDSATKAYGEGRVRTNVAYADVERAAIAILKSERRPTVETVRDAIGRGSNETIGEALRRFWRDLGARAEGDPAALTRMPVEIAELADGIWQRALKLAAEAAKYSDNAARERLEHIQVENDLKATSFALREHELDRQARERERALADSREHLLLALKTLAREQATNKSREARIADLESQLEEHRRQLATVIASVIAKHRKTAAKRPRRPARPKANKRVTPKRRVPSTGTRRQVKPLATSMPKGVKAARAAPI
jgi:Plasmid replication region DNA-binding N-term